MHDRVLDAAQTITVESGWASMTMATVADKTGVSRQTVYNESAINQTSPLNSVNRELDRFCTSFASACWHTMMSLPD